MMSILDFPNELQVKIFGQVPNELKTTCKTYAIMYNDFYQQLFHTRFGDEMMDQVVQDKQYLVDYIRSFDYWRNPIRLINSHSKSTCYKGLDCEFIKDSWKLVYGIYMNRRIYLDSRDYAVGSSSAHDGMYSVTVDKLIRLVPGLYNLSIGVILKTSSGINSTIFKIDDQYGRRQLEFQPASNFGELVPHDKFVLIDGGSFQVRKRSYESGQIEEINASHERVGGDNLCDMRLLVEEMGVYGTSGYVLSYIDINAYQLKDCTINRANGDITCKNEKYWVAWWIENEIPTPENLVNVLLKRVYKSIENTLSGEQNLIIEKLQVDIGEYNKKFYSKRNKDGELIERVFKFTTPRDRRRFEEWSSSLPQRQLYENEPLKWKMSTILEL